MGKISEIKEESRLLEKDIAKLLKSFMNKNGVCDISIRTETFRMYVEDIKSPVSWDIKTRVKIEI